VVAQTDEPAALLISQEVIIDFAVSQTEKSEGRLAKWE